MFLPATRAEMKALGWEYLDVILVTGDSYIDSPFSGTAVVGKVLADRGYRVGVIAQPDVTSSDDIVRLGEPRLFWGITGGSVDSMVANYTPAGKPRRQDDYTPGGVNSRRPDRAVIVYTNLVRKHFKKTCPIVLGGIEASLRRISHYDFWSDKVRRSVLFDAKADFLVYGMAEKSVLSLAAALDTGEDPSGIRGLCYASAKCPDGYLELPPHSAAAKDSRSLIRTFRLFYDNMDPLTATGLCQRQDSRFLVQNPPAYPLSQVELDHVYSLGFERDLHPWHRKDGEVRALDTIRFSLQTHRGCYGECNYCAIAVHEGRRVQWRSLENVLVEVREMTRHPAYKGIISDAGGPTANMYGFECEKKLSKGACREKRCLYPEVCRSLKPDHSRHGKLLEEIRGVPGVRKVFVSSGIRHDLVLADRRSGPGYLSQLCSHHVSGQLKVAPEHTRERVLALMGKPGIEGLIEFKKGFEKASAEAGKKQFLTYYLIAAHPGCTLEDMQQLADTAGRLFHVRPEQVQVFTPTPSTWSTLMYATGIDPFSGSPVYVEKTVAGRQQQKDMVTGQRTGKRSGRGRRAMDRRGRR